MYYTADNFHNFTLHMFYTLLFIPLPLLVLLLLLMDGAPLFPSSVVCRDDVQGILIIIISARLLLE